jgi:polysaccharide export outer membrane protein
MDGKSAGTAVYLENIYLQIVAAAFLLLALVPTGWSAAIPDYRISAEDLLEISVWKEEDLQKEVIVRPDGGISFPLAGDVQAAGLTPYELEQSISQGLQEFIPDAVVTVSVLEIRGLRIYVSGNVTAPGQYTVGRYVDVLQAITLAGGLTPFADKNSIRVIRRDEGGERVFKFNFGQVQRGVKLEQNILLQPDDVVVVP